MAKILENLLEIKSFTRSVRKSVKEMSPVCNEVDENINSQISILKNNSIDHLINMHPKFYRESLKFEDWDSSMHFLKDKKQEAFNFWNHDGN